MSVAPETIVHAITAAPNPRSETMVVGGIAGPNNAVKLLIDSSNGKLLLNAIIVPKNLPPEKLRVPVAIINSAGLVRDVMLSTVWSTPNLQVHVWGETEWVYEMHQLQKVGALPQPNGTQIIIP